MLIQPYLAGVICRNAVLDRSSVGNKDIARQVITLDMDISSAYLVSASFLAHPFMNAFFGIFFSLTGYFYFKAMLQDPGYVPKAGSRNQQKAIIDELLETRKFDETNFCVTCMVRRPLRSKHCKKCNRCVAKQDQYVLLVFS